MTDAMDNAVGLVGTGIGLAALGVGVGVFAKSMKQLEPNKKKAKKKPEKVWSVL